jgi:hypothetical protein
MRDDYQGAGWSEYMKLDRARLKAVMESDYAQEGIWEVAFHNDARWQLGSPNLVLTFTQV